MGATIRKAVYAVTDENSAPNEQRAAIHRCVLEQQVSSADASVHDAYVGWLTDTFGWDYVTHLRAMARA